MAAKLSNVLSKIFASGSGLNQISKFGSLFAGTPEYTTDPALVQSLSNYLDGWFSAAIGGNSPAIEDLNAVLFAMSYQLALYQQDGVPQWITTKEYFIGSLVSDGTGAIYCSVTDNNIGNLLSDDTNWTKVSGKVMTALGDFLYGGVNGALTRLGGNTTTTMQVLVQTGTGSESAAPQLRDFKAPTVQVLTGSGTYNRPSGVMYIKVKMMSGGGGGSGSGTVGGGTGTAGGSTTFGTSLLVCTGGSPGAFQNPTNGIGGIPTINSPAYGQAIKGGPGGGRQVNGSSGSTQLAGAPGGQGVFGGGSFGTLQSDIDAQDNTGGGGCGGGTSGTSNSEPGTGGGAGAYIEAIIPNPDATYSYSVGAKGNGGTAGTSGFAGGDGGSGYLIVEEYYQ